MSWGTVGLALVISLLHFLLNSCQMPNRPDFYRLASQTPTSTQPTPPAVVPVQAIAVNPPSLNFLLTGSAQHLSVSFTPATPPTKR